MRYRGKLVKWNDDRGFGFILPSKGESQVFVHIRDFRDRRRRPSEGYILEYAMGSDNQGRPCAQEVTYLGSRKGQALPRHNFSILTLIPFGFLAAVGFAATIERIPAEALLISAGVSVLTFFIYWQDKSAARSDRWRTPESTLHTLDLLGGWPGGLLAQRAFRHKTNKTSFQVVFWLIVTVHCVVLAGILGLDRVT